MTRAKAKDGLILDFVDSILVEPNRFRQQVLLSLAELFHYEHLTFFLTDQHGDLVRPITLNINPRYVQSYLQYFHSTDIFHPRNTGRLCFKKKVISIEDLMTYKEYEGSEYYNDFLKHQELYHELAIALLDGERVVGAIGIFRPVREKFVAEDIHSLNSLAKYIARALRLNLSFEKTLESKQMHEQCNQNSPYGIIVFSEETSIVYVNPRAEELVRAISGRDKSSVREFVQNITGAMGKHWPHGGSKALLSPSLEDYTVNIQPIIVGCDNAACFALSIQENHIAKDPEHRVGNSVGLSTRELEILNLVRRGLTNREIANELFVSPNTVKTHLQQIFRKMEVTNRTGLCHRIELANK